MDKGLFGNAKTMKEPISEELKEELSTGEEMLLARIGIYPQKALQWVQENNKNIFYQGSLTKGFFRWYVKNVEDIEHIEREQLEDDFKEILDEALEEWHETYPKEEELGEELEETMKILEDGHDYPLVVSEMYRIMNDLMVFKKGIYEDFFFLMHFLDELNLEELEMDEKDEKRLEKIKKKYKPVELPPLTQIDKEIIKEARVIKEGLK